MSETILLVIGHALFFGGFLFADVVYLIKGEKWLYGWFVPNYKLLIATAVVSYCFILFVTISRILDLVASN